MINRSTKKIAFFLPNLGGGGAEISVVRILKELVKKDTGWELDLVLADASGECRDEVPGQVRVINLGKRRVSLAMLSLARYLRRTKPSVLISHLSHANIIAKIAIVLSADTRLVVVEHDILPSITGVAIRERILRMLMRLLYRSVDRVIAVSDTCARDIETRLRLPWGSVKTIYNPVVSEELFDLAGMPVSDPRWFSGDGIPVFMAAGRLVEKKDFGMLLDTFAKVRKQRSCRLLLLGEGEMRKVLEEQLIRLGVEKDVFLPGFVKNPYACMRRADVFVLSSRREGFGIVLIEAMACGCSIVATDCPGGPREILEDGKYGTLTPVGDVDALASAMLETLDLPIETPQKELRLQRAAFFSAARAADNFLCLVNELTRQPSIVDKLNV